MHGVPAQTVSQSLHAPHRSPQQLRHPGAEQEGCVGERCVAAASRHYMKRTTTTTTTMTSSSMRPFSRLLCSVSSNSSSSKNSCLPLPITPHLAGRVPVLRVHGCAWSWQAGRQAIQTHPPIQKRAPHTSPHKQPSYTCEPSTSKGQLVRQPTSAGPSLGSRGHQGSMATAALYSGKDAASAAAVAPPQECPATARLRAARVWWGSGFRVG
jgi:hypothetical protein